MPASPPAENSSGHAIVLSRVLDAPRELVFAAWTDPRHLARWWGARGFTNPVCELDPRPGGAISIHMRGPDGQIYPMRGEVEEISPPGRLVFTSRIEDAAGATVLAVRSTLILTEREGRTALRLELLPIVAAPGAAAMLEGMPEGWNQSFERLSDELAAAQGFVVISRLFDAPRERVFAAWTDPQLLTRWYAPAGCTVRIAEFDLRPGGSFRTCIQDPEHGDCWCRAEFREIVAPERLVLVLVNTDAAGQPVDPSTIGMDPEWPGETLVTLRLTEEDGKTRLTLHQSVLESIARRTGAYPSWLSMLDRLAGTLR